MPTLNDLFAMGLSQSGHAALQNQIEAQWGQLQNSNISGALNQVVGWDPPFRLPPEVYFSPAPESLFLVRMPDGEVREVVTRPIAATPEPPKVEPPKPVVEGRSRWARLLDDEDLV